MECKYVCVCLCTYVHKYTDMYGHMYACVYLCIYKGIWTSGLTNMMEIKQIPVKPHGKPNTTYICN